MYVMYSKTNTNESFPSLVDLVEFAHMTKPKSVLEYPVVVAKVLDSITVSVPDIGHFEPAIPSPKKVLRNNRYVTDFDDEYALLIGKAVLKAWRAADTHIQEKRWVPDASRIKDILKVAEKDLSITEFTKEVQKSKRISQSTIRRDIDRGIIKASKTSGGHRRIPASEIQRYVSYLGNPTNLQF